MGWDRGEGPGGEEGPETVFGMQGKQTNERKKERKVKDMFTIIKMHNNRKSPTQKV